MSSKSQAYDIVGVSREVKVERSAVKEEDVSEGSLVSQWEMHDCNYVENAETFVEKMMNRVEQEKWDVVC
jgi:hypothetical protein